MFLLGEEVAQYEGAYKVIILRFTINTVYTARLMSFLFTVLVVFRMYSSG